MQILIKPVDLIERCLFPNYKKFLLKNNTEEEIKKIVEDNEAFIISEADAYTIGLLKPIKTIDLIHRFTINMSELVELKVIISNDELVICKNMVLDDINSFKRSARRHFISRME